MKRRIDEIPVSDRLDSAVAVGLNRAKFIHRRRVMKKSLAVAASMVVLIGTFFIWGFSNPILASQIPFIGHIFMQNEQKISFPGNYSEKAEALSTEIPETEASDTEVSDTEEMNTTEAKSTAYTVHDANYTFTVNEIYCDGSSIYLGMTVIADNGFGHIYETATERFGKTSAHMIFIMASSATLHAKNDSEIFLGNSCIEGTQISDNTLEGILKINLNDALLAPGENCTLDLDIMGMYYGAPDSPDMVPGVSYLCGDWKIPDIPFTVDSENLTICTFDDSNENGFGIRNVIITPYEIKIEYLLPPLYKTKEELLAAKREYAAEEGISMTDEEIDEYVELELFGNYGPSLFDANGKAFEYQESVETKDQKGILVTYSVKDADTSTLYFYIGEGDHESIKETDQNAMEARSLYKYVIETNAE
ncbi:MAG: DUF4179 domain-containing protein [Lachnospiraceae bacterium]|nr:DUF4179 domain-containing protein [Lachnospiraceae bacterium]